MMVVMMKSDQLLMPVMLFFLFYLGIVRFNNEAGVVVKKRITFKVYTVFATKIIALIVDAF